MRIIAGQLRSRQFKSPPGRRTHPMSEKARGALFNVLGDINGLSVLDAYAGSGAISYEAISRGAKSAQAVEKSIRAYRAIQKNIDDLDMTGSVKVSRSNITTWSDNNLDQEYDVVVADPPYDDIKPDVLDKLARHVKTGGMLVISWPGHEEIRQFEGVELIKHNSLGDIKLLFFRKS